MAERFVGRYAAAMELMERGVEFMPVPMKRFEKYRLREHWHSFLQYDNERGIFEVRTAIYNNRGNNVHTLNESAKLCSCGKWSIYHMPCSHAIKCFQRVGYAETNYVDQQYSVSKYLNTYSGQLQPVGAEHYWPPEHLKWCVTSPICVKDRCIRERVYGTKWMLVTPFMRANVVYARKQDMTVVNVLQLIWVTELIKLVVGVLLVYLTTHELML